MSVAPFVSFLSDYGNSDEFVGVCKAVMVGIAPDITVIDITHEIPRHDVRAGGLALARSVQYLPSGVVLGVVDPGVGTSRRCIAVAFEQGFLVGPDNGLLAPAVAVLGGASVVVTLDNPEFALPALGSTFAGRDVMAPAAAHLIAGVPIDQLGGRVDPAGLVPGLLPLSTIGEGNIEAEVLWIDHFGNCQINVDPEQLAELGASLGLSVQVAIAGQSRLVRWVNTYADGSDGELIVVVDSCGMVTLAVNRNSAAEVTGLHAGAAVKLSAGGDSS